MVELKTNSLYEILDSGRRIGRVSFHCNPYHAKNYYLDLDLIQYDSSLAKELFTLLHSKLSRPLQVMLYSHEIEKCAFLVSGGFIRKRQCYEMNVSADDLIIPVKKSILIEEVERGDLIYWDCCEQLYDSYAKSHERISPLTANRELFYSDLPNKIKFYRENDTILHYAFIDDNEIAYIGTNRQSTFHAFAESLLSQMLVQYNRISFECDDCDSVAMQLKAFFYTQNVDTYDTYILE